MTSVVNTSACNEDERGWSLVIVSVRSAVPAADRTVSYALWVTTALINTGLRCCSNNCVGWTPARPAPSLCGRAAGASSRPSSPCHAWNSRGADGCSVLQHRAIDFCIYQASHSQPVVYTHTYHINRLIEAGHTYVNTHLFIYVLIIVW